MEDSATHLAERVLPAVPIRQWVLSPPSELCGLLAARGAVLSKMSTLFVDAISRNLRTWAKDELGLGKVTCGAVVILQRFTNTLAVFPHLHILFLDGVYEARDDDAPPVFHACPRPDAMTMLNVGRDFFAKMERYLTKNGFLDGDHERETPEDAWFVRAMHEPSMLEKAPVQFRVLREIGQTNGVSQVCSLGSACAIRSEHGRSRCSSARSLSARAWRSAFRRMGNPSRRDLFTLSHYGLHRFCLRFVGCLATTLHARLDIATSV